MNTIKGFGQWVGEDFFDVYIKFHHNYNFFFKIDAEKHSKMSRVDRCKELLKHFIEIKIQSKSYFIKMPCMHCGVDGANVRNHVIGDANYLKKYLSRNGYVYALKRDYKRNFDRKDENDPMFWSYENFRWEYRGHHRSPDVTFRGFCNDCDTKLFSDIDDGMKNKKDFFKQIYRSACSLYFRILEQAVKDCYITDMLEDCGWSDMRLQSEYRGIERKPVNPKSARIRALQAAYLNYRIMKELQAGLDCEKDVVNVVSLCVENPSIYCGFMYGRVPFGGGFEMVNNLYREVDHISDVFVVLPLHKNETVLLNVTLPLGIKGYVPMDEYLSAFDRPDIVLTRYIVELGLGSLCDLYMSPRFYDSLPPEYLDSITDVSKHSDLSAISLFDMDFDETRTDFSRWKGIYETWQRRKGL